jgi:hypothetical protein
MARISGANGEVPGYRAHGNNLGMPPNPVLHNIDDEFDDCDRYWGPDRDERFFVVSIDTLDQLFEVSPTDQIAIRVANFDIPELIQITFHSFDGRVPVDDVTRDDIYYFILHAKYYFGTEAPIRILGLRNGTSTNCITVRPGRLVSGEFVIYPISTKLEFKKDGVGNGSGSPGLKIPSNP